MDANSDNTKNSSSDLNKIIASIDIQSGVEIQSEADAKDMIHWIMSRRSIGMLDTPAPNAEQVEMAIQCAMTAPDHKKLQPWRFIVTTGSARERLGQAFLEAAIASAKREGTTLNEKTTEKTANMPMRAPMIITVVTKMTYHEKVPKYEQLLSTGAAVQNLILALKAQGFNTVWRTGLLANEPAVKSYFNVGAEDYITAFVYVGSNQNDEPPRSDIDTSEYVRFDS